MPMFPGRVISVRAAVEQACPGGSTLKSWLLSGQDPIRLWTVQVGIIVGTASLLALGLSKVHQPKVIAEVLGGILLGPTAFGRIPGFTQHVFPLGSRPYLSLVANIGLVLFLFLVGLEIDTTVIKRNLRLSAMVAVAGMILPFGIGAGMAHAMYKEFIDPHIQFTHFMLFAGVAYSITAFPVLCRILTELNLLDTTVGIVVLSAGVGNDIGAVYVLRIWIMLKYAVGWVLLALSVALVNASTSLTALYILLACVGWTLFLLFPIKMALLWIARKTGSIESGPSVFFMTVTMMIVFGSSFFTDVIGVHAIFGAFVAGLIVPREGGLAITITEKLEDMVSIIFLPLYFTLSGLSTDLTLLNDGVTWAYTIAIIITAFVGKFGGCTVAAHYFAGFNWRESSTIGSLMSCKGLVELIVLNVGLSAGILSQRVFSMFVLEALVLTFMTTPLVTWLYPLRLRRRISATGVFNNIADDDEITTSAVKQEKGTLKTRFTVVLDKLEHVAGMMAVTQLIQPFVPPHLSNNHHHQSKSGTMTHRDPSTSQQTESMAPRFVAAEALRLIELSDRVSAVMKSSASESLLRTDPVLSIFRMFGQLNGIRVTSSLSVVKFDDLANSVVDHARNHGSDMIFLPWLPAPVHDAITPGNQTPLFLTPTPTQQAIALPPTPAGVCPFPPATRSPLSPNPFELLFRSSNFSKSPGGMSVPSSPAPWSPVPGGFGEVSSSLAITHSQFVRGIFSQSTIDVALFVDQSTLDPPASVGVGEGILGEDGGHKQQQHVFLPFFGGPDDRLALEFVVQICANPRIKGTVVRITKTEGVAEAAPATPDHDPARPDEETILLDPKRPEELNKLTVGSRPAGIPDTVYSQQNTEIRLQSETADNVIWARYANSPPKSIHSNASSSPSARPHIEFTTLNTPTPLHAGLDQAFGIAVGSPPSLKLFIVTGRSRRLAVERHRNELKELLDEFSPKVVSTEIRKTVGDVATAFVVAAVGSGIVVVQAAGNVD